MSGEEDLKSAQRRPASSNKRGRRY